MKRIYSFEITLIDAIYDALFALIDILEARRRNVHRAWTSSK